MVPARLSDTLVIQAFFNRSIPAWIQRCLDSVRKWAGLHGFDYSLAGDEFCSLCGQEFLSRGSKNPRTISNLARFVATRQHLDAGYQRVIWMDADIFVFDPEKLVFNFPAERLTLGYAFGREVWIDRGQLGVLRAWRPGAHGAATFFTQGAVDLDMLIALIRHIDAKREIISSYQIGVGLLRNLQQTLMFQTFSHVGLFSPILLNALAQRNRRILRFYGRAYRYQQYAANLCLALEDKTNKEVLWLAMDHLEGGAGDIINKYATEAGVHLVPCNENSRPRRMFFG
jgi:hypothetical protein